MQNPLLNLQNLQSRHPGVSDGLALSYEEAARVCFSRHHEPIIELDVSEGDETATYQVDWAAPNAALRAAWANNVDATEFAGYCVALAVVEDMRDLIAIGRAETRSGADYLLAPRSRPDVEDFENVVRLEVSGTDGDHATLRRRLSEKISQAERGESDAPAMAVVVGLRVRSVLMAAVAAS